MSVFKDHKTSLKHVLEFIPKTLLSHLSTTTKVDYYSKVQNVLSSSILHFRQRKTKPKNIGRLFNSSGFKTLFGLGEEEKVSRSSISERLYKIDSNYFKEICLNVIW